MSKTCPICSKPTDTAFKPFCSKRCANVDLQRWLVGSYSVPGGRDEDEQDGVSTLNSDDEE